MDNCDIIKELQKTYSEEDVNLWKEEYRDWTFLTPVQRKAWEESKLIKGNSAVNPLTNVKVKAGTPAYKKLDEACMISRPLSAQRLWAKSQHFKEEDDIHTMWKELATVEKTKWIKIAEIDKRRFNIEVRMENEHVSASANNSEISSSESEDDSSSSSNETSVSEDESETEHITPVQPSKKKTVSRSSTAAADKAKRDREKEKEKLRKEKEKEKVRKEKEKEKLRKEKEKEKLRLQKEKEKEKLRKEKLKKASVKPKTR